MNCEWDPALPVVILWPAAAVVVLLLVYSYIRLKGSRLTVSGYLLLRLAALALLFLALAGLVSRVAVDTSRRLNAVVLIDASKSMAKDYERIRKTLLPTLEAHGIRYTQRYFARTTSETPEHLDTSATDLATALAVAASAAPAATLLVSDGMANTGGSPLLAWRPACGRLFAAYPRREALQFRLSPPAGSKETENTPGVSLPQQASAGSEFKVTVRVAAAEAPATAGLTVTLRGPIRSHDLSAAKTVKKMNAQLTGHGPKMKGGQSLAHEFSMSAPVAGYYIVDAELVWPAGKETARRFIEITPGLLKSVYLEGLIGWRLAHMSQFGRLAADEIDLSTFRLYAADPGAEQAIAGAETIVLGGFPQDGVAAPLRAALEAALARAAGFVFLWDASSPKWLDLLPLRGPERYTPATSRLAGAVRLEAAAARRLGLPPFDFTPVWQEDWAFGADFKAFFQDGVGGFSPCWYPAGSTSPLFVQEASLGLLLSTKAGCEFLSAAIYHAAGRQRSAAPLQLSLAPNLLAPGGLQLVRAAGAAMLQKGRLQVALLKGGRWEAIVALETGTSGSVSHTLRTEEPGELLFRAHLVTPGEEITAYAACMVEGEGVEDPQAPAEDAMLAELAHLSNGMALTEDEAPARLAEFLNSLPQPLPAAPHKTPWRTRPLLWIILIAALAAEWALRTR